MIKNAFNYHFWMLAILTETEFIFNSIVSRKSCPEVYLIYLTKLQFTIQFPQIRTSSEQQTAELSKQWTWSRTHHTRPGENRNFQFPLYLS